MTATATPPAANTNQGPAGSPPADTGSLLGSAPQQQEQPAADAKAPPADDIKYEFKAPEGHEFDPEVIKTYGEVAKEIKLAPEAAQKVLDKLAPVLQARFAEQAKATHAQFAKEQEAEWRKAAAEDKDFGGKNLPTNLSLAISGAKDLGGEELVELLKTHVIGSNLTVLRALAKHGKAISQDNFVPAQGGGGAADAHPANVLFPNMKR